MILVDSTPLVALCDRSDALHERATRDLDRIRRNRFVVSDAVLAEVVHLLVGRRSRVRLCALVEELPIAPSADERARESRTAAFQWLERYSEHRPDWADAVLVVASANDPKARV